MTSPFIDNCIQQIENHPINIKDLDKLKFDIVSSWYSKGIDNASECNFLQDAIYRLKQCILDYKLCLSSIQKITDEEYKNGYNNVVLQPTRDKLTMILNQIETTCNNRDDGRYVQVCDNLVEILK